MSKAALISAIDAAGGQTTLARKIGLTQGHIWFWLERSKKGIPAEWCAAVERETGVPVHQLRPDIFPAPIADHSSLAVATEKEDAPDARALHGQQPSSAFLNRETAR